MRVLALLVSSAAALAAQPAARDAAALALSGEKLMRAGQLEKAAAAFEEALKRDAGNFNALYGLGLMHFSQGRFEDAEYHLRRALATRPKSFQARFLLGAALAALDKDEDAIRELRAACELDPKHLDAAKLLATRYMIAGRHLDAAARLKPFAAGGVRDEELYLLLIESHQNGGDTAAALALTQKAVAMFPSSARLNCWMGYQLQFNARYEEARKYIEKAMRLDPEYQGTYYLYGDILLKERQYKEAIPYFRKAIEKWPEDTESRIGLSQALVNLGEIRSAVEELQKAAAAAPRDSRVQLQLSRLYFRLGDEEKAKAAAELSLRLKGEGPPVPDIPAAPAAISAGGRGKD